MALKVAACCLVHQTGVRHHRYLIRERSQDPVEAPDSWDLLDNLDSPVRDNWDQMDYMDHMAQDNQARKDIDRTEVVGIRKLPLEK